MEAIDNITYKLKSFPLWKRLIIVVAIPIAWAGQEAFTTLEELSKNVVELKEQNNVLISKLEKNKDKQKNIDKLREKLKLTQAQLREAQKVFPDEYDLELRLADFALIAARTGTQIQSFVPGEKATKGDTIKWEEFNLKISLVGTYMQIALFFDSVNHLPVLIKTKSLKIDAFLPKEKAGTEEKLSENDVARILRQNVRVKVDAELTLYKAQEDMIASVNSGVGMESVPMEGQTGASGDQEKTEE